MRVIIDLSDFDASRWVIPTGQSGHPFSAHYDDQIDLWLNGQYLPMRSSREAVETAAVDHLVLQP
jgi:penicillin amidase